MAQTTQDVTPTAKPRRDVQLNIRVAAETKAQIERAAKVSRQSLTEFTTSAVVERAEEILARHDQIVLSDRDYELFTQMMTADTEPTEIALQEAAEFRAGQKDGARYRW